MVEIGVWRAMCAAVQRGVRVVVYTDEDLNVGDARSEVKRNKLDLAVARLAAGGVATVFVRRLHSKIVMADRRIYCVGSFNWLSAAREGDFVRHETSLLYRGDGLSHEIDVIMQSLANRASPGPAPGGQRQGHAAAADMPIQI